MQDITTIKIPLKELISWKDVKFTHHDIDEYQIYKSVPSADDACSMFLQSLSYEPMSRTLGARTKLRDDRHITLWVECITKCNQRFSQKIRINPLDHCSASLRFMAEPVAVNNNIDSNDGNIIARFL